jgi:hypothetical protein
MAKQNKATQTRPQAAEPEDNKPVYTRIAYLLCVCIIALGLVAQIIMAIVVYTSLPTHIPASWFGSAVPQNPVHSWLIFIWFPAAQVVLLVLTAFSPRDEEGRHVMDSGLSTTLIILGLLFTALQASAFHIPYYGT